MSLTSLNCPNCGAPAPETLQPNQQFTCPACHSVLMLMDLVTADQTLCPACRTANPNTHATCTQCGATLQHACAFCRATNPITATHCQNCGANLKTAQARQQDWLAEKRQYDAEREVATKQALAEDEQQRLQRLINSLDEPENHGLAIYSLAQLGGSAVDSLIETLQRDPDDDARFGAAHALGQLGDARAGPALLAALRDPAPMVRYWAVEALSQFNDEATHAALRALRNDKHPGVRARVQQALKHQAPASATTRFSSEVVLLAFIAVLCLVVLAGVAYWLIAQ